jgi:hypothetical protein
MSNPTTPFGWQMPTATDLVTDLPADFEVFGQAVATSMADLLGGTTGQVLAKASNTDMDFVWSADAAGMVNPMTTTGDTIYSSPGSTPVRLPIGSTGQGLAVVAGIPAWTASATSTLTTTGDMLYASAANTLARVGVGSTGNVLTVAGGVPTWAAPAGAGDNWTLVNTGGTSLSGSNSVTISGITDANTIMAIVYEAASATAAVNMYLRINGDTGSNYNNTGYSLFATDNSSTWQGAITSGGWNTNSLMYLGGTANTANAALNGFFKISGCKTSGVKVVEFTGQGAANGGNYQSGYNGAGIYESTSAVTSVTFRITGAPTFNAGKIYVYKA